MAKVDGQWTIWGLAQEVGVHRSWLYTRIRNGTLPATRHPATGQYRQGYGRCGLDTPKRRFLRGA